MAGKSESKTSQSATTSTDYETNTLTQDTGGGNLLGQGSAIITKTADDGGILQGDNAGFFSLENGISVAENGRVDVTDFGVLGTAISEVAGFSRKALETNARLLDSFLDRSGSVVQDVLDSSTGQAKEALNFANRQGENDLKGVFPILVYGGVAIAALYAFSRKN